ncbi:hypothetical protein ACLOJK_020450 [Asimina triloba]
MASRFLLLSCLILLAHVFTPTLARILLLSDAHPVPVQPRDERGDHAGSDPPIPSELAGDSSHPPASNEELGRKDEEKTEREPAESPEYERLENGGPRHHGQDGSIACGGAIVGGLATAAFAVVFCYIRVTRRRNAVADAK